MTPGDRFFQGAPVPRTRGCPNCGGLGYVLDEIDEERYPVRVPCYFCQQWCEVCKSFQRKPHNHPPTSAPTEPLVPGA